MSHVCSWVLALHALRTNISEQGFSVWNNSKKTWNKAAMILAGSVDLLMLTTMPKRCSSYRRGCVLCRMYGNSDKKEDMWWQIPEMPAFSKKVNQETSLSTMYLLFLLSICCSFFGQICSKVACLQYRLKGAVISPVICKIIISFFCVWIVSFFSYKNFMNYVLKL